MKVTPSSTARRSTRLHSSGSAGSPQMPGPVRRMAPKPIRLTVRSSPSAVVPAAAALVAVVFFISGLLSLVGLVCCPPNADQRMHTTARGRSSIVLPAQDLVEHLLVGIRQYLLSLAQKDGC